MISFDSDQEEIEEGDVVYTNIEVNDTLFPLEWVSGVFIANSDKDRLEGNLTRFAVGDSMGLKVDKEYFNEFYSNDLKVLLKIDSIVKKKELNFQRYSERVKIDRSLDTF